MASRTILATALTIGGATLATLIGRDLPRHGVSALETAAVAICVLTAAVTLSFLALTRARAWSCATPGCTATIRGQDAAAAERHHHANN